MSDERLLTAYRNTSYFADTPAGRQRIRIGETHPALDTLLTARGHRHWAYVTAHNPGSVPLTAEENRARHRRLEADVRARGYEVFPGEGIGDDGEWPPEASLLILGMPRAEATALGHAHAQRAVVWGGVGESALLLICSRHPAESAQAEPPKDAL
jgi:Protein of unknown function (DUF3293)